MDIRRQEEFATDAEAGNQHNTCKAVERAQSGQPDSYSIEPLPNRIDGALQHVMAGM